MEITDTSVHLHSTEYFITDTFGEAYLISQGDVLVYIVPWIDEKAGKRVLLCEVPQGAVIPGFVYRDRDYKQWRFMIAARSETELKRMPSSITSVLQRKFAQRAAISNYEEEGFENSIVERYKREVVNDDVFIERGKQQAPKAKAESFYAIKSAFDKESSYIVGDDPAYKAVAYACFKMGIKMPAYEKINSICGEKLTIKNVALASDLLCRDVVLEEDWYHNDCGMIIGNIDEEIIVCISRGHNYQYYNLWRYET